MKIRSLALALLLVPLAARAGSGWTTTAQVAELIPTSQGRFLVKLKVSGNPSGCRDNEMFYRDFGNPGSEQMFQTLLQAVAAEKPVRVYVTGRCEVNGYSEFASVGISP